MKLDNICLYVLASLPGSHFVKTKGATDRGDAVDLQDVEESDVNNQFPPNLF